MMPPSLRPALIALATALAACSREPPPAPVPPTAAAPSTPLARAPVTLTLDRAAVIRNEHGVRVECDATLTNATAAPLPAATNFGSVFDGLSLVLSSEDNKEIARQAYVYHQSPYARDREIVLPVGATHHPLVFPIDGIGAGVRALRVALVGGLPGRGHPQDLASNAILAVVTEGESPK
jgi:hypothetical protein